MCKKKFTAITLVAIILIIGTVLGSIYDYEISKFVYLGQYPNKNFFGILFAFIGIIPTFVGWSFLGASILALIQKNNYTQTKKRWLIALSILLFVLSFFYFCNTLMMVNNNAFHVHWAIAYPIGIAVIIIVSYVGYTLTKSSDNPDLLKTVVFLSFISLLTMIIIMSTKGIMNRPRFRFVLESANTEYFRNWWQSGKDIKLSLGANAITDEFSSFPSGHSAYSMFAIFLFPTLADYISRLKKYKVLLFIVGFVWWGLTAISRLTVGAHYLTDVCIAGLVTILSYGIITLINNFLLKKH